MYVIEVIPLKKGLQLETLTYFSSLPYSFGTLVEVPVRNRTASAVVIRSTEASSTKTALRAATFSLRKLPQQTNVSSLAPGLIKTAKELHREYPFALGTILLSLLPSEIRNGQISFPQCFTNGPSLPDTFPPEVLMAERNARFTSHRSLIRNTFAHGGSVLFVVPTVAHIKNTVAELEDGIADRVFGNACNMI